MADPFLTAHLVAPLQFELGGTPWPISIRDQMVRGQLFVTRALRERLIDGRRPLFVVGAGAAGITAAMAASQRGVTTHVIEQLPAPFTRQALCLTRWIDPTQYDWPQALWAGGAYSPYVPPPVPLPWRAGRAAAIALGWRMRLRALPPPGATIDYAHQITGIVVLPNMLRVFHGPPGGPSTYDDVGALVSSIGFGTEDTQINAFRGWHFWETDPLEQANMGLPAKQRPLAIISGAGDGALQDFVRMVTGRRSARDVLGALPALSAQVTEEVAHIEDRAGRSYLWGTGTADDHPVLEWTHQQYLNIVRNLVADPVFWRAASTALNNLISPDRTNVRVVFGCTHLGKTYALNHFLAVLLAEYLEQRTGAQIFVPRLRLRTVLPMTPHSCGAPNTCHGEEHELEFVDAPDCRRRPGASVSSRRRANVLVVRHGIQPPAYIYQGVPAPAPRQHLPYHLFV